MQKCEGRKSFISKFFLGWLIVMTILTEVIADTKPLVFSTWEGFESDKCASIWLIKRFIDKDAKIKFYPKGDEKIDGIKFDTPDATYRRYFNMSTFESLLKHYQIKDKEVIYIGRIIHDIEINTWEKKVMEETRYVQDSINQIISNSANNEELVKKSNNLFDSLYHRFSQINFH